jgi:sugar lactone lactonase YvrE
VGYESFGSYSSCFWDSTVNPGDTGIGNITDPPEVIGESTTNMQTQSTYTSASWDFATPIWIIPSDGIDYPHLVWEGPSYPGNGTAGDPHQISIAEQLNEIGIWPFYWDKHFILTADINLSGYIYTTAVIAPDTNGASGSTFDGTVFTGVFDGAGYVISNLTIDDAGASNDFLGLFGKIDGSSVQIKNLALVDVNVSGDSFVASLAGYNNQGTISNCYANGNVTGSGDNIGGLVGGNYGPINNCYTRGYVSGVDKVGGLVGRNSGNITNCYSAAKILEKMYWVDGILAKIQRANLDGTNVEDVVTSVLSDPLSIALDTAAGKMYWIDSGSNKIQRANLNGTNIEVLTVYSVAPYPSDIALDTAAGKMYWTDSYTGKIQRANLDGTDVEDLVTGLSVAVGIALDTTAGKMYWVDRGTDKIQRANLDGTGVEDLVTSGLFDPRDIALDTAVGKMYWTDYALHKIQRANLDGTDVEDLITSGLSTPFGIALDTAADKIYWTDAGTDKIQRSNLGGTGVEDLVTSGLSHPRGIDLALITNGGGLVGFDDGGSYTKCFWDNNINLDVNGIGNTTDPNVIAKSTAEMQTETTYTSAGWDFVGETVNGHNDIWRLCEDGAEYPKLGWQYLLGDFVCPDGVEFYDLSALCEHWLLWKLSADVVPDGGDGIVNFLDYADLVNTWQGTSQDMAELFTFSEQWLQVGATLAEITPFDIAPPPDGDGMVNMLDFAVFAENWLEGVE